MRVTRASSVSPSSISMTRNGRPSSSTPSSITRTTPGCSTLFCGEVRLADEARRTPSSSLASSLMQHLHCHDGVARPDRPIHGPRAPLAEEIEQVPAVGEDAPDPRRTRGLRARRRRRRPSLPRVVARAPSCRRIHRRGLGSLGSCHRMASGRKTLTRSRRTQAPIWSSMSPSARSDDQIRASDRHSTATDDLSTASHVPVLVIAWPMFVIHRLDRGLRCPEWRRPTRPASWRDLRACSRAQSGATRSSESSRSPSFAWEAHGVHGGEPRRGAGVPRALLREGLVASQAKAAMKKMDAGRSSARKRGSWSRRRRSLPRPQQPRTPLSLPLLRTPLRLIRQSHWACSKRPGRAWRSSPGSSFTCGVTRRTSCDGSRRRYARSTRRREAAAPSDGSKVALVGFAQAAFPLHRVPARLRGEGRVKEDDGGPVQVRGLPPKR